MNNQLNRIKIKSKLWKEVRNLCFNLIHKVSNSKQNNRQKKIKNNKNKSQN